MIVRNYLAGRIAMMKGQVDLEGANLRALIVKAGSTFMTDTGILVVDDFTDLKEFASVGYARQTLIGNTITPDTLRDRAVFDADNPIWLSLIDDDLPIAGVVVIQHITDDTDSIPLYGYQLNSTVNPGGEDYEFPFPASGIAEI